MSKLKKLLLSPAFWIITVVFAGGYFLADWVNAQGGPEAISERFGILAPVVTGFCLFILTPTPFPTDIIAVAHGAIYGFVFAALLNWVVLLCAALLEASVGRRLGSDVQFEDQVEKLPGFIQRFPVGHPLFLILGRQVPMVGSNITTLVPGAMGVPLPRILWCSAIGIIPGATALAAAGAGLLIL